MYLLIDESGRLVDPAEDLFVIVGVVIESLTGLSRISQRARSRIPRKGNRRHEMLRELKFSYTGNRTRIFVLNEIFKLDINIFSYQIFKKGISIPDSPLQYGCLIAEIIRMASSDYDISHTLVDRHFTNKRQIEVCDKIIAENSRKDVFIEHLDSADHPALILPDFVAGSIRQGSLGLDMTYREIIKDKIKKDSRNEL